MAEPFAGEARFRQPVTLAAREQPLEDFLGELRRSQRLPVRADAATRDERLTLFCRDRPVGEILAAVARHFDYTWMRRGGAGEWVLTQTAEQRQREARERRAEQAAALAGLVQRVAQRLEKARRAPAERPRMREVRIDPVTGEGPNGEKPLGRFASVNGQPVEMRMILDAPDGEGDAFNAALLAMQPADWDQVWQGQPFRFSYPARPGRVSLSHEQAARMVRTAVEELSQSAPDAEGYIQHGTFAGVDRLLGEVTLAQHNGLPLVRFRCRYVGREPERRDQGTVYAEVDPHGPEPRPDDPDLVDPAAPDLRSWVQIPPLPPAPAGRTPPTLAMADYLALLAPSVPYALIGDSYESDAFFSTAPAGRHQLDAWLRDWCRVQRVGVRREGTVLHFRRRGWAQLRPLQVPARLTRSWEAHLKEGGILPLRDLVQLAGSCSDEQVAMLQQRWQRRQLLTDGESGLLQRNLEESLEPLRLIATLTPAEWKLLRRPGGPWLSLRRPAQIALLLQWLQGYGRQREFHYEGPDEEPETRPLEAILDDEERLEAGLTIARLRLRASPHTFYLGRHSGGFIAEDRDKALRLERQVDPRATLEQVPPIHGTRWEIDLDPQPDRRLAALGWWFVTAEPPPPRRE